MNSSQPTTMVCSALRACLPQVGRSSKDARLIIGAVIIKHKLNLSNRETVAQIQESPYLRHFVGPVCCRQGEAPFVPSLFIEIRKRMGQSVFGVFYETVIEAVGRAKQKAVAKRKRPACSRQPPSDDEG